MEARQQVYTDSRAVHKPAQSRCRSAPQISNLAPAIERTTGSTNKIKEPTHIPAIVGSCYSVRSCQLRGSGQPGRGDNNQFHKPNNSVFSILQRYTSEFLDVRFIACLGRLRCRRGLVLSTAEKERKKKARAGRHRARKQEMGAGQGSLGKTLLLRAGRSSLYSWREKLCPRSPT